MMGNRVGALGLLLVLVGAVLVGAGAVVGATSGAVLTGRQPGGEAWGFRDSMMGGWDARSAPGPGEPGFAAGTVARPRIVRVLAGPGYTFTPASIPVARGETVTFEVTSMGGLVHEFMVGPAADVAADKDGTPEVAGLGMMDTKSVTYTFDGPGPYAFACHVPGHAEAGMRGTIELVG